MEYKIDWTEPALDDLREAVEFIAQHDADAARRIGFEVVDHISLLAAFPFIGPVYRRTQRSEVRQIVCRDFRIFYRVREKKKVVEILHVWHGLRDEPPLTH